MRAVFAPSFAGLFYRNAFNLGLPALICEQAGGIPDGCEVSLPSDRPVIVASALNTQWKYEPAPPFLQAMVDAGGLLAQLRQQLQGQQHLKQTRDS